MLQVGLKGKKTVVVTTENTAERMLSGLLPVYATPSLIAFMEYTCSETVRPFLDAGMSTVGTLVNIKHTSASPVGSTITCECELAQIDGRKLIFNVIAHDDFGPVGEGVHERFVINNDKFMSKARVIKIRKPKNPSLRYGLHPRDEFFCYCFVISKQHL